MDRVIAVFDNRNHSMQFASILKRMGIVNRTVSTPRELSVSCGISVIFPYDNVKQAKMILFKNGFVNNVKMYLVRNNDSYKKYKPI